MRRRAHNGQEVVDQQNALLRGRIPLAALIQTLSVAEYLNFRHAANALGVSQSSVSTRIKTLEEDLGVVLFERRHRGVRLTDAGRSFITEVAAGISHLDLAIKTAGAARFSGIRHSGKPAGTACAKTLDRAYSAWLTAGLRMARISGVARSR